MVKFNPKVLTSLFRPKPKPPTVSGNMVQIVDDFKPGMPTTVATPVKNPSLLQTIYGTPKQLGMMAGGAAGAGLILGTEYDDMLLDALGGALGLGGGAGTSGNGANTAQSTTSGMSGSSQCGSSYDPYLPCFEMEKHKQEVCGAAAAQFQASMKQHGCNTSCTNKAAKRCTVKKRRKSNKCGCKKKKTSKCGCKH